MLKQVFFIVLLTSAAAAQEAALQFEQANQFYRAGDFRKAAQMFEEIVVNGYESPALYYNLGNSYFKLQEIPAAILNFERAKILSPGDDDISYNLRLANLRVVDKIEPIPTLFFIDWWKSFIALFSADGWAVAGILALWLAAISAILVLVSRKVILQRIYFFTCALAILFGILSFTGMYQRIQLSENFRFAIVFSQSVSVKSAPDSRGTDLFVLHEGVKVEFLDSVGTWRKIRLEDGKIGWLSAESVQII